MGKPSSDMILRHVIGRSNSSTDVPYFRRTNNKSKIYAEEKSAPEIPVRNDKASEYNEVGGKYFLVIEIVYARSINPS